MGPLTVVAVEILFDRRNLPQGDEMNSYTAGDGLKAIVGFDGA